MNYMEQKYNNYYFFKFFVFIIEIMTANIKWIYFVPYYCIKIFIIIYCVLDYFLFAHRKVINFEQMIKNLKIKQKKLLSRKRMDIFRYYFQSKSNDQIESNHLQCLKILFFMLSVLAPLQTRVKYMIRAHNVNYYFC